MKKKNLKIIALIFSVLLLSGAIFFPRIFPGKRLIEKSVYLDKVHGAWLGKMIGVYYGQYTEFGISWSKQDEPLKITWREKDYTNNIPSGWIIAPEYANDQDDIGINLLNLSILEKHGLKPSGKQIAEVWVANNPAVACANFAALQNMRKKIYPPLSGNPAFNPRYRDIDAQIDNDVFGMITPGLPNASERFTFKFAKVTSSEEGVYPAVFIAQCISNAFFEKDVKTIIKKSLKKIPPESLTARVVKDVIAWQAANKDWRTTRQLIVQKYPLPDIFALPNLGFVVSALLYGNGDFEKTAQIATFCGYDSDCNPATSLGILGAMHGASKIPEVFKKAVGDVFYNQTVKNYPGKIPIKEIASKTAAIGEKVILKNKGIIIKKGEKEFYSFPKERLHEAKRDDIPISWDDIRKVREKLRDDSVKALIDRKDVQEMKDSLSRLQALGEIDSQLIDAFTKSALYTAATKMPVFAIQAGKALAAVKDARGSRIFTSALKDKNIPFASWLDLHYALSPYYNDPYIATFFLRELVIYKDYDTSKALELIGFFRHTPENVTNKAMDIMKEMKPKNPDKYLQKIMQLHFHSSLKIRDRAEAELPMKSMEWNGWEVRCLGKAPLVGAMESYNKREDVLCTHPYSIDFPCYLSKWVELDKDTSCVLSFDVTPYNKEIAVESVGGYTLYQKADWILQVIIDGIWMDNQAITWKNQECRWEHFEYDLSRYAGKKIGIILQNAPKEWYWEQAFWNNIKITPKKPPKDGDKNRMGINNK